MLSTLQLYDDGSVAARQGAMSLPPLVRFHYSKTLLDWALMAVVKGIPGQNKAAKNGDAARDIREQEARLRLDCWRIATALLASQSVPATYQLPAALVPTVTALLTQLSAALPENGEGSQALQLLQQLGQLLSLLSGKFSASSRPSLEHAVGLAEAALAGWQSAEAAGKGRDDAGSTGQAAQAWVAVAQGAVAILQVWQPCLVRVPHGMLQLVNEHYSGSCLPGNATIAGPVVSCRSLQAAQPQEGTHMLFESKGSARSFPALSLSEGCGCVSPRAPQGVGGGAASPPGATGQYWLLRCSTG